MDRASRCPFCVTLLPSRSLLSRLISFRRTEACGHCGRSFNRRTGEHVAHLFDNITRGFESRVADELKTLRICDRAEVLVQFGLKMEDTKVASADMLLRALAQTLEHQLGGLARGCEGRYNIKKVERGNCAVVDIDVLVEDGKHSRRRLRIARIEHNGFIQAELGLQEAGPVRQIAR